MPPAIIINYIPNPYWLIVIPKLTSLIIDYVFMFPSIVYTRCKSSIETEQPVYHFVAEYPPHLSAA